MAHKNYYPKIDAYVRRSWTNDTGGQLGDGDVTSAGITISYNLYRGGADEAQVEKSLVQIMKEKELKNDVIRKLDEQGRLSWSAKTYVAQQLVYLNRYAQTSAKTLELYQQEYDLGRRTLLDLLVAQNDYVAARSQIIKAENDVMFANYRILDAMGTMVQNVLGSKTTDYTGRVQLGAVDAGLDHDETIGTTLFKKRETDVQ
jgi:outer membrane protein, adhesin transport system